MPVVSVGRSASGRTLFRTGDGQRKCDVVVGADGHRSVTRALVALDVRPVPAGHLVWRGTIPLTALRDRPKPLELLRTAWVTPGFPGGHTPDWAGMGPADVEAWSRAALNGTASSLYGRMHRP
ncbi:hypothetical protein [Streptomyces sp. CB01580]|uniref:hypothetical protein n=1 Tax=Streptomyces sp. CB01580 TaxID=1703933 RepID=UPI001300EE1B|nr:hypothetical protein [Streptomyces sp. CB01580]